MRIIFAGTPEFAVTCLQGLLASHHEVIAVYTQPDRPAGRGRRLAKTAIKQFAEQQALAVRQPVSLRDPRVQEEIRQFHPDVMIVVAYGLILPDEVLKIPHKGCLNVHASLLPRWRGSAPIQRAILAGDTETGVSLMQMEVGLDTGAILSEIRCPILETDTTHTLQSRLATLGAECLVSGLDQLEHLQANARPQNNTSCCYAEKIHKSEALLNWKLPAIQILRQIRAFNPWPVSFTYLGARRMRVWQAIYWDETPSIQKATPGMITQLVSEGIVVATGEGSVCISHIQWEGGKSISVSTHSPQSLFQIASGMQFV